MPPSRAQGQLLDEPCESLMFEIHTLQSLLYAAVAKRRVRRFVESCNPLPLCRTGRNENAILTIVDLFRNTTDSRRNRNRSEAAGENYGAGLRSSFIWQQDCVGLPHDRYQRFSRLKTSSYIQALGRLQSIRKGPRRYEAPPVISFIGERSNQSHVLGASLHSELQARRSVRCCAHSHIKAEKAFWLRVRNHAEGRGVWQPNRIGDEIRMTDHAIGHAQRFGQSNIQSGTSRVGFMVVRHNHKFSSDRTSGKIDRQFGDRKKPTVNDHQSRPPEPDGPDCGRHHPGVLHTAGATGQFSGPVNGDLATRSGNQLHRNAVTANR